MLPIVGRQADVWHTFSSDRQMLNHKRGIVSRAAEAAGRDPEAIAVSTSLSLDPAMDEIKRNIAAMAAAGVSHFTVGWPGAGKPKVDAFAEAVL